MHLQVGIVVHGAGVGSSLQEGMRCTGHHARCMQAMICLKSKLLRVRPCRLILCCTLHLCAGVVPGVDNADLICKAAGS
jgi:hypothetical protein